MSALTVRDFSKRGDAIPVPTQTRVQLEAYNRFVQNDKPYDSRDTASMALATASPSTKSCAPTGGVECLSPEAWALHPAWIACGWTCGGSQHDGRDALALDP